MRKVSRRARRIQRNHSLRKSPGLNLVSLMDIFTILVFFLLVNASSDSELPSQKVMTLPESAGGKTPEETLRVVVTPEAVLVQGEQVATTESFVDQSDLAWKALREELEYRLSLSATGGSDTLTVLADRSVPYEVIKSIVTVSQSLEFRQVAFAASQISSAEGEEARL